MLTHLQKKLCDKRENNFKFHDNRIAKESLNVQMLNVVLLRKYS